MPEIPLTKGFVAVVDEIDFEQVSRYNWVAKVTPRKVYAQRAFPIGDNKQGWETLHHFLMPDEPEIDHKDGDGLNNRRGNLRPCTRTQNLRGFVRKRLSASSKFRGVSFQVSNEKWRADIQVSRKRIYLGIFSSEEDAARAYDSAAVKFFGDFATPNFP